MATQEEVNQAEADKTILQARRTYIDGDFVADEISKINSFIANPYLGSSMKTNLEAVKAELVDSPTDRKDREKATIDAKIVELDVIIDEGVT